MRTDRQTDVTNLADALHNSSKAPKVMALSLCAPKDVGKRGGVTPLFLNLGTRGGYLASSSGHISAA